MSFRLNHRWVQDSFMGTPIQCNKNHPSIRNILETLYVLVYGCARSFRHPRGYHVRTRLANEATPAQYSAHFNNFYKLKSGYIPLRVSVKELDDSGFHFHHAVILKDKFDTKASLQALHAKMYKEGILQDYSIICPKSDKYGQHLETDQDFDSYFKWMSYLAKVWTKPEQGQILSGSRQVTTKLKRWKIIGKPDLRLKK